MALHLGIAVGTLVVGWISGTATAAITTNLRNIHFLFFIFVSASSLLMLLEFLARCRSNVSLVFDPFNLFSRDTIGTTRKPDCGNLAYPYPAVHTMDRSIELSS
jgi:hypothetical protein